ncbi:hypothetical protein MesoLj113a_44740 [Mesorhizobium sp. 113-1-2]|nr:hypothetical protein MesoLj113a_44740 [Mesorhizobium sp. 113-1-2]
MGLGFLLFLWAEPAHDLFMEAGSNSRYWFVFFLFVFAWALIVHYASRKVVQQQAWAAQGQVPLSPTALAALRTKYALPATVIPRLLGFACFAAVGVGIWRARSDLGAVSQAMGGSFHDPVAKLLPWLCLVATIYLGYVVARRGFVGGTGGSWKVFLYHSATGKNASLLTEAKLLWFADLLTSRGRQRRGPGKLHWDYLALALLAAQILGWLLILFFPLPFASAFPRALFVVLMLAAPVSLLAFLSAASHQTRFPVPSAIIAICLVLTGLTSSFHDIRLLSADVGVVDQRQDLKSALYGWAALNCPSTPLELCHETPIIVATAGGASRAAFFTATVVGDLLDNTPKFGQRLFAFSGVSGGSVGAVMIRAALVQASSASTTPCNKKNENDWLWFRHQAPPNNWRECLQSLTAGDFLSPAFIGLAFRDLFGFLPLPTFDDRAALLEKAIEARYDLVVGGDGPAPDSGDHPLGTEKPSPLENPLGRLKEATGWQPLLFLNATSAATGRRVIAADILPVFQNGNQAFRLFPEAFDLFDMLRVADNAHCRDAVAVSGQNSQAKCYKQVRLSTAGVASARFPVISPQAIVRGDSGTVDGLVDGGYFENDGLTTARELAEAIHTVAGNLQPIIIEITNAPVPDEDEQSCNPSPVRNLPASEVQAVALGDVIALDDGTSNSDQKPAYRTLAAEPGHGKDGQLCNPKAKITWHDALTGPFKALEGTLGGHAAEAYLAAENDAQLHILSFFRFQVFHSLPMLDDSEASLGDKLPGTETCSLAGPSRPAGKQRVDDLSMSWWLSDAVQAYLDRQLCQNGNQRQYRALQACLAATDSPSRDETCLRSSSVVALSHDSRTETQ